MAKWILPKVGPPDAEGFRTFTFIAPGVGETIRVSFNLERQRRYLEGTSSDHEQYSSTELKRLKLAARLIAARDTFPENDRIGALEAIFATTPKLIAKTLEDYYPSFALLALRAASDVCVKHTLNQAVRSTGAPQVYDEVMLEEILREFKAVASEFMGIHPGRPIETSDHIKKVTKAIRSLEKDGALRLRDGYPSQTQLAKTLNVDPRALRKWAESCGLKWPEFLRACGWNRKAERN
jgi:hypothetical protein